MTLSEATLPGVSATLSEVWPTLPKVSPTRLKARMTPPKVLPTFLVADTSESVADFRLKLQPRETVGTSTLAMVRINPLPPFMKPLFSQTFGHPLPAHPLCLNGAIQRAVSSSLRFRSVFAMEVVCHE